MKTYLLRLFAHAADHHPEAFQTINCSTDAQALGEAWKLLSRRRECVAVEAWTNGTKLFRLGNEPGHWLGRWSRT